MDDQLLRSYVERHFGKRITDRPDCEALSQQIFSKTHLFISYNTLRRFFRLAGNNDSNPSNSTLNILSIYCGYRSYDEFMRIALNSDPVLVAHNLLLSLQDEDNLTIDFLKDELEKLRDQRILFGVIPSIIQRTFFLGKTELLNRLFELEVIFNNKHYLHADLYFLMQLIGDELRKHHTLSEKIWKTWATIPLARFYYFELFVDMDNLIHSHHYAISHYYKASETKQDKLFALSLLFWKAFWSNNQREYNKLYNELTFIELTPELHPIPVARALNCLLVHEYRAGGKVSYELNQTIERYRKQYSNHPEPFFNYWIIEGLAITHQWEKCLAYIEELEENWNLKSHQYFHGGANEKLKIVALLCYKKLGKQYEVKQIKPTIVARNCYSFSRSYDLLFHPDWERFNEISEVTKSTYKLLIHQLHGF